MTSRSSQGQLRSWERVEQGINGAKKQLAQATTSEQFQQVGLLCRETLISLAQAVYDSGLYPSVDGVIPSDTDAQRMLDAYITKELAGHSEEEARRQVKASLSLANSLQHNRTASRRDAALCTEAVSGLVNLIRLVAGETSAGSVPAVCIDFSYRAISYSARLHHYQLVIKVTNKGSTSINRFKLEFTFPDLDSIPLRWLAVVQTEEAKGPLISIEPTSDAVHVTRAKYRIHVAYWSTKPLFPGEHQELGDLVGLRYQINDDIFGNIEEMPPLHWILYADDVPPTEGDVSLEVLNNY